MNRKKTLELFLVAALGAIAMLVLPAIAAAKDRNHDRIPDRWEKRHNLSLKVNQAGRDQDRDHLRNRAEFLAGDNPRNSDSDGDGIPDGNENAGTIQSFDAATGKLTIALFGGETLSGMVTEQTEIECGNESSAKVSDNGGDESGDAPDEAGEEPGDDSGDEADESGDDSGPGSPNSGPGDGEGDDNTAGASCTTADMTEGATVKEAEVKLENGGATFEKVELAG